MSKPHHNSAESSDAIAREAAHLLARREAATMTDALRLANEAINDGRHRTPSPGRVRQHAQAMTMQEMGEAAYRAQHARWLAMAEELMTTIEQALPLSDTLLVGRAAEAGEGHFDADPSIHVRVHSTHSTTEIAQSLAMFGYDDPEMKFPTMESRHGRLSQIQWVEEGVRIVLTRCPQRSVFEEPHDLVTGKFTAHLTLVQLRPLVNGGHV